jgi:predicted nucleotidyltransferase
MNRSHAISLLTQSKPALSARYGVTRLALFGSTARDAARSDSERVANPDLPWRLSLLLVIA